MAHEELHGRAGFSDRVPSTRRPRGRAEVYWASTICIHSHGVPTASRRKGTKRVQLQRCFHPLAPREATTDGKPTRLRDRAPRCTCPGAPAAQRSTATGTAPSLRAAAGPGPFPLRAPKPCRAAAPASRPVPAGFGRGPERDGAARAPRPRPPHLFFSLSAVIAAAVGSCAASRAGAGSAPARGTRGSAGGRPGSAGVGVAGSPPRRAYSLRTLPRIVRPARGRQRRRRDGRERLGGGLCGSAPPAESSHFKPWAAAGRGGRAGPSAPAPAPARPRRRRRARQWGPPPPLPVSPPPAPAPARPRGSRAPGPGMPCAPSPPLPFLFFFLQLISFP